MSAIVQQVLSNSNDARSPGVESPKSPRRFLKTIRNSPSILRKKIRAKDPPPHDDVESPSGTPERERRGLGSRLRAATGEGSTVPESKVFQVLYQGKLRVATLQVHEAMAAVKKLTLLSGKTFDTEKNGGDNIGSPKSPRLSPKISRSPKLSPMLKKRNKSPKKNNLKVTPKYLSVDDPKSSEMEVIPISTIAYCATDIRHPRAVAFINKDQIGGLVCHVLLCETKEKASSIVSCIGKMFESAWEEWKETHPDPLKGLVSPSCLGRSSSFHSSTRDYRTSSNLTVPGDEAGYQQKRRPRSFNGQDGYSDMELDS